MAAIASGVTPAVANNSSSGANAGPVRPSSEVSLTASASTGPVASGPQRPGTGGKKWSEVCEQVQKPDGSVRAGRTSPPFKSAGASAGTSPPRPRQAPGLYRRPSRGRTSLCAGGIPYKDPSRGGSSRGGSSGKSSRSSSRDIARDGDISSRCSSGCWETSTNSSEPITDLIPSPLESKGLLMPDPIRTGIIPPALLAEDHAASAEAVRVEPEQPPEKVGGYETCGDSTSAGDAAAAGVAVGMPLKWDPFGRDGAGRRQEGSRSSWTPETLASYLKGVAVQIDDNLSHGRLPTPDRLDAFVSRLVAHSQRQLKHAPRKVRHQLHATFTLRFQTFWNFTHNRKVRSITPDDLKTILTTLVENLSNSDWATSVDQPLAQPKPLRYYSYGQVIRPGPIESA